MLCGTPWRTISASTAFSLTEFYSLENNNKIISVVVQANKCMISELKFNNNLQMCPTTYKHSLYSCYKLDT